VTIKELHHIIPEVPKTTIHEAVTNKLRVEKFLRTLGAKNVNERSQNEKGGFRAEDSHALRKEVDEFLDSIVTADETWVFHHAPESKHCNGAICIPPQRNFISPGATIYSALYCDTLTRLRRAIQNKRRGMLSRGVWLLHDNTRPYSTHVTTALLKQRSSPMDLTIYLNK
jgi:hypothetical protein